MIDTGLAADGAVDLRKQRRRHLDEINATHVTGCGETGNVPHNATAQRNDGRVAVGAVLDERVENILHGFEGLVRLTVRQADHADLLAGEVREQRIEIQRLDRFVGDHEAVGTANVAREIEVAAEQSATDENRVAALTEFDRYGSRVRHGGRRLQHPGEAHRRE